MHGQKKRRKRTVGGIARIDGLTLAWQLVSEPQWSSGDGRYIGMCVSVKVVGAARRELLLEFPFPTDGAGRRLFLPQRPAITEAIVDGEIRAALVGGWDPGSRGKRFVYEVIAK